MNARDITPATTTAVSLADVEKHCEKFSKSRNTVKGLVQELNDLIAQVKRERMPAIKRALQKACEDKDALKVLVEHNPQLFERPRTVIFHGIKTGYAKGKGTIDWEDDEKTSALIEKHLPDQYDVLVKETRKPLATPLKELSVADLKKIGCTVEETGDYVVVKATDTEVEKIVNALLADALEAETAASN